MAFYSKLCTLLGFCPDANNVALLVLGMCIVSGICVGVTGVLAYQQVMHKRKEGAE